MPAKAPTANTLVYTVRTVTHPTVAARYDQARSIEVTLPFLSILRHDPEPLKPYWLRDGQIIRKRLPPPRKPRPRGHQGPRQKVLVAAE